LPDRVKVLLCEPYYTGSHRSWADGIAAHSAHDVRLVTHDGAFWKWRMQGGALTLATQINALVEQWGRPDVVLVSDMVHLPALLGFTRDALRDVPVVLYMHENQLTYPVPEGVEVDHTYAMTNWLSMAAADRVVFNSAYHRDAVFDAVPKLLRRFPDYRHSDHVDRVRKASTVLPVGVDLDRFARPRLANDVPTVLWNHRWEYDKDPEAFFAALSRVASRGVDFRVIVAGQQYRTVPDVFERARRELGDRIVGFGTASEDDYPSLLAGADVVISTAQHEFFGVAVVEAIAAGALPLFPDRLSYPELVPRSDPFLYGSRDELVERLVWALTNAGPRVAAARDAREFVERFGWRAVAPAYDAMFVATTEGRRRG
jgi:glycosyltransferase involved in cell wall biosynthesis